MADVFADALGPLAGILNLGVGFWFIAFSLVMVGIGAWIIFNRRYPTQLFMLDKNGVVSFSTFRLDGNLILPNNMLTILLSRPALSESLTDFERVYVMGKGWVYEAWYENGALLPLHRRRVKADGEAFVEPEELSQGRKVALRYVEAKKFAQQQVKSSEPLGLALITALPTALVVCMFVIGLYLAVDSLVQNSQKAAQTNMETMKLANATMVQMNLLLEKSGMPKVTFYNASGERPAGG